MHVFTASANCLVFVTAPCHNVTTISQRSSIGCASWGKNMLQAARLQHVKTTRTRNSANRRKLAQTTEKCARRTSSQLTQKTLTTRRSAPQPRERNSGGQQQLCSQMLFAPEINHLNKQPTAITFRSMKSDMLSLWGSTQMFKTSANTDVRRALKMTKLRHRHLFEPEYHTVTSESHWGNSANVVDAIMKLPPHHLWFGVSPQASGAAAGCCCAGDMRHSPSFRWTGRYAWAPHGRRSRPHSATHAVVSSVHKIFLTWIQSNLLQSCESEFPGASGQTPRRLKITFQLRP